MDVAPRVVGSPVIQAETEALEDDFPGYSLPVWLHVRSLEGLVSTWKSQKVNRYWCSVGRDIFSKIYTQNLMEV